MYEYTENITLSSDKECQLTEFNYQFELNLVAWIQLQS